MNIEDIKIPCLNLQQKVNLIEAAEQTALRYCAPVYLVGSSLTKEFPNDVDIYVAVSEQTYLRLFTNFGKKTESNENHSANIIAMQLQQARIYKKNKDYFESRVKSWDFDVKFQHIEQFLRHSGERLRLDYVFADLW